jgi:hypothetical protein
LQYTLDAYLVQAGIKAPYQQIADNFLHHFTCLMLEYPIFNLLFGQRESHKNKTKEPDR